MFSFKKYFQSTKENPEEINSYKADPERQLKFNFRDQPEEKQLSFDFKKYKYPFGFRPYSALPEEKKIMAMSFLNQLLKMLANDDFGIINYLTSRDRLDLVKIVSDKDLIPVIKMEITKNKKIRENLIKVIAKELIHKNVHKDLESATNAAEFIVKQNVSPKEGLFNRLFNRN